MQVLSDNETPKESIPNLGGIASQCALSKTAVWETKKMPVLRGHWKLWNQEPNNSCTSFFKGNILKITFALFDPQKNIETLVICGNLMTSDEID